MPILINSLSDLNFLIEPIAIGLLVLFFYRCYRNISKRQDHIFRLLHIMRTEMIQKINYIEEAQFLLAHHIDEKTKEIEDKEKEIKKGWTEEKRKQMSDLKKAHWAKKRAAKLDDSLEN